jgi:hypothetical protein
MAMYFVNYLDRINLGIAKTDISKHLQLSATMFGLASGIFFIGYVLVEVPSNLGIGTPSTSKMAAFNAAAANPGPASVHLVSRTSTMHESAVPRCPRVEGFAGLLMPWSRRNGRNRLIVKM